LFLSNITPLNIPHLTIAVYLKLIALGMSILGFTIAIELNNITCHLKTIFNSYSSNFSNILEFFPSCIPEHPYKCPLNKPKNSINYSRFNLTTKIYPETISDSQITVSTTFSNQEGIIKLNIFAFLLSIIL
jgi:NADH-ubiquinone oxidoreductase chain 5